MTQQGWDETETPVTRSPLQFFDLDTEWLLWLGPGLEEGFSMMRTAPFPDYPCKCFHVLWPDLFPGREGANTSLQVVFLTGHYRCCRQTANPPPQWAFDCLSVLCFWTTVTHIGNLLRRSFCLPPPAVLWTNPTITKSKAIIKGVLTPHKAAGWPPFPPFSQYL